jgi:hypothetical protein
MSRALVVATMLLASSFARAEEPPAEPREAGNVSTPRRLAAVGASIFPGVLLHGSGSYILGEKRAAKRLAISGGIGWGALIVGGAAVGITGGNPSVTLVGVPLILAGAGTMMSTWLADIWYAAGGRRIGASSHAPAPWSIDLGTTYLHDTYRERSHARVAGRLELGRIGVGASTLLDVEGQSRTGDLEARVRLLGKPATGGSVTDASRLWIRAAVRRHADDDDMVEISTIEADIGMRFELGRLDRNLRSTFLDLSIGMGIERVRFADLVSDDDTLFLGRFAWGMFLGRQSELTVFYDHRRDSLAGGIAASRAAGFVGSVGANTELRIGGPFSFIGELEIGSGWVTTAGVRYHGGPL